MNRIKSEFTQPYTYTTRNKKSSKQSLDSHLIVLHLNVQTVDGKKLILQGRMENQVANIHPSLILYSVLVLSACLELNLIFAATCIGWIAGEQTSKCNRLV